MKIRKLTMVNAFQHKKLDISFTDFHAIIGANGSGKSNIVESIRYMLTNKFMLPGTNDTMIREGADSGHLEMTIESEGDMINTKATLGKASRTLKRGDEKMAKSAEITEYIQTVLLRSSPDAVNQSSIIAQGSLDSGLFDTQARRTAVFLRLAGLSNVERKRDKLYVAVSENTVPMLAFNIDELTKKIEELKASRLLIESEINAIPVYDAVALEEARNVVSSANNAEFAIKSLEVIRKDLDESKSVLLDARQSVAATEAKLKEYTANLAMLSSKEDGARDLVAAYNQSKAAADNRAAVEKSMADVDAKLTALEDKNPGEYTGSDTAELQRIRIETEMELKTLEYTLTAFSGELRECPTCKVAHTKESAQKVIDDARKSKEELTGVLTEVVAAIAEGTAQLAAWKSAKATYDKAHGELVMQAEKLLSAYQTISDSAVLDDPVDAKKLITQLSSAKTKQTTLSQSFSELTTITNDALVQVTKLTEKEAALMKQAAGAVDIAKLAESKNLVEEHQLSVSNLAEKKGRIQGIDNQLDDEQDRLDEMLAKKEEADRLMAFNQYLEYARGALHRDCFPSGKVKAFVDRMLISANVYLDAMLAGFSISYDKEVGFIAYFPTTDKSMRADRLSGGQKVTFSLAFRFAVNELHTETGFLILDEPTVWLDDLHIEAVVRALSLVKSKLTPRTQVIVVTHDEKLAAVCDGVSEIPS